MKKNFVFIVLLGIVCRGFCQPQFDSLSFPNSVNLFDKFEVSFILLNSYSNPYDPQVISAYATFYSPDGHIYRADAFYFEDYVFGWENRYEIVTNSLQHVGWRIRFTPNQIGTWRFTITGTDANGTSTIPNNGGLKTYVFTCNAVTNADGFISKANSKFLKREVVKNGQRQFQSFFPIGPNVAWYECESYYDYSTPYGKYYYKKYIDSLSGNANYMRVFLNRYQYLSLYGPEYTQFDQQGHPVVYFDSTINQKDSAELDYIIEYAAQHGVAIMPSVFSCGDYTEGTIGDHKPADSSIWSNNPFHTILNLDEPCKFFGDDNAKRITKNLIRYIVSRWGYATNIMCWELWNEVSNVFPMCDDNSGDLQDSVLSWHNEMAAYIRSCDPYQHCVSTSMGRLKATYDSSHTNYNYDLYLDLYNNLDIVQQHVYKNIRNAESRMQISNVLYDTITKAHNDFLSKPFFIGEFGFSQGADVHEEKDSCGINLHNSLWSSLFSTAIGPGSFWWWGYLNHCRLFHNRYSPLLTFCQDLPILSETFTAHRTGDTIKHQLVFPNGLETYYMINATEDTIYGWSQDTAFAYQSLRWLTDNAQRYNIPNISPYNYIILFKENDVFDPNGYAYTLDLTKRPSPSSNSNVITIPISHWSVGISYKITWYNTETGLAYPFHSTATIWSNGGNKYVSFNFPSAIRDVNNHTINNTFGDVAFSLVLLKNGSLNKNNSQ